MNRRHIQNFVMLTSSSGIIMQIFSCMPDQVLEFAQTVFLGISAAGSLALLRNI